ncbi:DNA polymerase I [Corynebacterium sp. zg-331]|uniref:DNA polymerase I n=1 Tax=unclassified Corynebacterium TaxID=2624378 RepID=UPI00128E326E|nr:MULTISPECIES: DNA polymerase I [unclassified Corynebacterium]MBC3186914.1 DNA polymerase I [Corynebacterium sp. zg-331]MPV53394.1 DNA polymerase I [Corynebacterium sp. zg331]
MSQRLLLIDGHSMAFRAFYALPVEKFSTAGGQHTNAVYGFLSMLANLVKEERPTHLGVAFDVGRSTFRTEMFPEYKAQRESAPEAFRGQVALIQKVLNTLGIVTMTKENYEADDIIATLVTATPEGFDTRIVTGDRDYYQLVTDSVTVLYPRKGVSELDRFTPRAIEEKYGLTPEQYPDFAALRGDPSDNLPNIPGVGEKTAQKWIREYGTLSNLLEHAEEIKGKAGNNFRERLDQVRMNRELTQMVRDVSLDVTVEKLALRPVNVARAAEAFDELEFGAQLRGRVLDALPTEGNEPVPSDDTPQVTFVEQGVEWLRGRSGVALALDGEEKLACVSPEYEAVLIDLAELSPQQEGEVARWLDSGAAKYLHGAKEVARRLRERGFTLRGVEHDTLIAAYLLRPGQRTYELDEIYQRHAKRSLEEGAVNAAVAVLELSALLAEELQEIQGYELYADLEVPLAGILERMERAGVAVDRATLDEQREAFVEQVDEEVAAARALAGDPELNLSSPKQLQVVLFDTLGLPKTKKTKTGYSTAAKEIEQLAVNHPHPFLDHLLAHREYQKLKTTLDGLIKAVGPDGRIHTTFNQTVASTGRLSSTEPNLQNIPVRTDAGRRIRSAFRVGEGYETLLTADYSQIEMRVMAHLSQDPGLIEAYSKGEDLHNYVGSKVFDVPIDGVTPELRRRVKAMSYGLVYGLSAYGLSQQLGIPAGEAKRIMEAYFERFGGVKSYLDEVVERARRDGYTSTLFGRRRYLPELSSTNRVARENAERAALNAPIQGTAADIIKVAMIRVDRALVDAGVASRVLLQVHDELVVEVAPGELDGVREIVEHEMGRAISLRVPLEVSVGVGHNWEEAAH